MLRNGSRAWTSFRRAYKADKLKLQELRCRAHNKSRTRPRMNRFDIAGSRSSPSTNRNLVAALPIWDNQQTKFTAGEPILTPTKPSRKRKTASLLSAAASGIHKYRSRASATVYYDGEVQESFDKLVRNISTGRNNIRKSRMTDRITTMISMHDRVQEAPGMSSASTRVPVLRSVRSASGMQPRFDQLLQEGLRSSRGPAVRPQPFAQSSPADSKSDSAVTKYDTREEVGRALDTAQNLCERGAHQFLRDGDCGEEVSGAKKAFEDVLRISGIELERLKQEEEGAAKAAATRSQLSAKARKDRFGLTNEHSTDQSTSAEHQPSAPQNLAFMDTNGMIEADDDEDGSDDDYDDPSFLPSPPFRRMART